MPPPSRPTGTLKVLVIDDDQSILEAMRGAIESMGYTVKTYSDPREAIGDFQACYYDVAMIDLGMKVNGLIVMRDHLLAADPDLPCVIFSGNKDPDDVAAAMKAGAFDFIGKPPQRGELRAVLHHAAERRRG